MLVTEQVPPEPILPISRIGKLRRALKTPGAPLAFILD